MSSIERSAQEWIAVQLRDLALALRDVHKALLEVEASKAGVVNNPGRLLELATTDEGFAWLRNLSTLMAELDEQREEDALWTMATVTKYHDAIKALILTTDEAPNEFGQRYFTAMQQSPAVVMAHAALRRVLGNLTPRSNASH